MAQHYDHRQRRQTQRDSEHFCKRHADNAAGVPKVPCPNNWAKPAASMTAISPLPQCPVAPFSIQAPKTPPFSSPSFRRLDTGLQPISPPHPLRLATANAVGGLPRLVPIVARPCPPPLYPMCIGHPGLQVYKVRLPGHLIHRLDEIIQRAENHAGSEGWKTELYSLTKCDIPCKDVPGLSEYIKPISNYIYQAMQFLYGCAKITVDKNQPHILKYSKESSYTGVELHHDCCDITANLVLSRSDTYVGGGTTVAAIGQVIRLEQGEFLLHPGSLIHGGNPITAGTRYLLVTFADLDQ